MVLNICNFTQRTEQVPIELDISAIEDYILSLKLKSPIKITGPTHMVASQNEMVVIMDYILLNLNKL